MFPSPLGVIFSLILRIYLCHYPLYIYHVSVSSRSYILSYRRKMLDKKEIILIVSVSSRSYILSYWTMLLEIIT